MKPQNNDLNFKALVAVATLALAVALTGCATTGAPSNKAPAAAPTTQAAVSPPASAAAPSGDKGTVVFFREKKFAGGAVSFKVREGEQELGKLSSGTYFVAAVPSGPHAFIVHSEAKDVLNLEVEPGETYYVQGSISMGLMVGRPNLAPSSEATFNAMKDKLRDSGGPKK
jgi:hypothetical protein